eukprot:1383495-Rhodomonas_salina.1
MAQPEQNDGSTTATDTTFTLTQSCDSLWRAARQDVETKTLLIVLIPVCSVIACSCCVACLAWYCGKCPAFLQKCPGPLRRLCVYEEEEDEESGQVSEEQKKGAKFDAEAARDSLRSRGAWVLDVLVLRAQNLPRLDWAINDRNLVGTSDPFVQLKVLDDKADTRAGNWRRTKVKRATLHPDFVQSFRFYLHDQSLTNNAKLALEVLACGIHGRQYDLCNPDHDVRRLAGVGLGSLQAE